MIVLGHSRSATKRKRNASRGGREAVEDDGGRGGREARWFVM